MLFPLDIEYLIDLAQQFSGDRDALELRISETRDNIVRYANLARLSKNDNEKCMLHEKQNTAEQMLTRLTLLESFFTWYDMLSVKPALDCEVFRLFAESPTCSMESRYPLLTAYWKAIFTKHLIHEKDAADVIALATEFVEPEKFSAFVLWLIEREISVEQIIGSKIFDYFFSTYYGVDFAAFTTLMKIVKYHAKYNERVKALHDGLVNRPVEIQGPTSVFHNASASPSDSNGDEASQLPAVRINDPTHQYFSTNVFNQRFSHAEKFHLPERFRALKLPFFSYTEDTSNIENLLDLLGLLPLMELFSSVITLDQREWIQCSLRKAYAADKKKCLQDIETFVIYIYNPHKHIENSSVWLQSIVNIISKNDLPDLLETQPFFVFLFLYKKDLFSEIPESKIIESFRSIIARARLSTPILELLVLSLKGRTIRDQQLRIDIKHSIFNHVIDMPDVPNSILPILQRDRDIFNLCCSKMQIYLESLSSAFLPDDPYHSLLQKWSELLHAINAIRVFYPYIKTEYPFDIYNVQLYALRKLVHHKNNTLSLQDFHAFLETLVNENSASPIEDKIRFVCKAMYTISDPALLKLLQNYLQDKDLINAVKSADPQVRLVAILFQAKIFTVKDRDVITKERDTQVFLDAITRLFNAGSLTHKTFVALISRDFIFRHEGVRSAVDLLIQWVACSKDALQYLQKANISNEANLITVEKIRFDRFYLQKLSQAFKQLSDVDALCTQHIFDHMCCAQFPSVVAYNLCTRHQLQQAAFFSSAVSSDVPATPVPPPFPVQPK